MYDTIGKIPKEQKEKIHIRVCIQPHRPRERENNLNSPHRDRMKRKLFSYSSTLARILVS